ncbi:hypothetical protein AB6A40_003252 [Gnathostoma spinigerum]|uniref:Uncharacterized protein n=1 Tax=Gnathostoma spinigerum TaxID=75299 RepID=A0ABD6EHU8_9BILA
MDHTERVSRKDLNGQQARGLMRRATFCHEEDEDEDITSNSDTETDRRQRDRSSSDDTAAKLDSVDVVTVAEGHVESTITPI